MTSNPESQHEDDIVLLEQVEALNEEVKTLSLNLAIYLARAKSESKAEVLNRMEPEFIRLVNGTVKVVGELTAILNAARNMEQMVYELPTGRVLLDQIEVKLRSVVFQCSHILGSLSDQGPQPVDR
jgi:hypothetical protein